ncbi:hypothetical protein Q8A67_000042 [Cirrhinus molitorella]|uniref:AIG1-type G domain-containing protein n=1 Tax=Cirrhinus molitorella TaxID=172907 RepID=A0AA88TXC7_9TELE|nr:hypothetical protein Q8A67_000042 [Cirrhinus molitorella]
MFTSIFYRQPRLQLNKPTLIHQGPPKQFRLDTVRKVLDDNGKVRKWTYGEKDDRKQNKIILLVGETGAGKTTLINTMVNYLLGVKFEEEKGYEITEEAASDQSESQTSEITMYEVFPEKSYISLTIIDTPGYGDTRGLEKDLQVAENLATLFQTNDGVREIDAVCFVTQASKNCLCDRQHYIISSILSLFGRDIVNNIVFLITHSDGLEPKNIIGAINKAKIPCRKDKRGQPVYFLFNNRQADTRENKERQIRAQRDAWEDSMDSVMHFLQSLDERNRISLELTSDVLMERIRFEASICNLQLRIQEKESKKMCHHSKHVKENKKYIISTSSTMMEFDDFQKKYEKAQEQTKRFSVIMDHLDKDLQELEDQKLMLLYNAYKAIKNLSQIALKPDSAFTLQHLDFFIPRVREARKEDWVRDLEKMKEKAVSEEANKDALSYLRAGLAKLNL